MTGRRRVRRLVSSHFGNIFWRVENEKQWKKDMYREAVSKCCLPSCNNGYNLQVHHIIPVKKGGTDTFDNYLCCCDYCHMHSRFHSRSEENRVMLYVYKFYMEKEIFGFTSDPKENSDDIFLMKLRDILKVRQETRTKFENKYINCCVCNQRFYQRNTWDKKCSSCLSKSHLKPSQNASKPKYSPLGQ